MIPVSIDALIFGTGPDKSVVVLRPFVDMFSDNKVLPMYIGNAEAVAISMAIENRKTERPQTHELMLNIIDSLEAKVVRVVIDRVDGLSFYSRIVLNHNGCEFNIDARPSDALTLAIRDDAPIYVESPVFVAAAMNFNPRRDSFKEKEIEAFHDFVERLDPEDFKISGLGEDD